MYADWLTARGDPRGELIALQYRVDRVDPENGELLEYRDEYLRRHPRLVPALDPWQTRYRWRWGFIEHAWIDDPSVGELRELLDHPSCRLLQALEIVAPYVDAPALVHALLDVPHPTIESLTFEQWHPAPGDPEHAAETDSWSQLPRLRHLAVQGHALSTTLRHPTLQTLEIRHGHPFGDNPPWDLPAVTTLSWKQSSDPDLPPLNQGPSYLDALWSAHLPSLRHLDLSRCGVRPADGAPGLLEHEGFLRLLPGLETLKIHLDAIRSDSAEAVELLLRQARRLDHLRELYVDSDDLELDEEERLRGSLRNLRCRPWE